MKIYEQTNLIRGFKTVSEGGTTNIPFTLLNKIHNEKGYFYTFLTPSETPLNTILLNFNDENFDWLADVEGSNEQKTWFTIAENQRLTGISNAETQFHYTKLSFEKVAYTYIRLCIKTNKEPLFQNNSTAPSPSFFNQWWLWGIILVIILVLGYQTLKMMQEKGS